MNDSFSVEIADNIGVVTMKKRAMDPQFFNDCLELTNSLKENNAVRAVVLKSDEKAFSYGLDLQASFKEFGHLFIGGGLAGPRSELLALIRHWQAAMTGFAELPVPVIVAVHSWCIGGGLDLISACDIRLATRDAKLSLREARIGIVADLGSLQRLPNIIGGGLTRELAFTAADFSGQRAHEIGLVNHVFETVQEVHDHAMIMAKEIASNPPLTIQGVKEIFLRSEDAKLREGLNFVAAWNSAFLASEDLAEALSAHMAKREPNYKGK
jgi:enoyl-CoA hydratase